jgi:hypothetical protein
LGSSAAVQAAAAFLPRWLRRQPAGVGA